MAITATTLSAALGASDTSLIVASATGITAPNFQTGSGITWLFIDQEYFLVVGVTGTVISVLRGQNGTQAVAHVVNSQVQIGLATDFLKFNDIFGTEMVSQMTIGAKKQNAVFLKGATDAVLSSVPGYYVVKTAGVDAITLPTPAVADEGNVIEIWSDTANAHTVTCPTTNFAIGAAANKTICTFPARPGAGIALRVCNGNYHLMYTSGTGTNSGPVVWT